MTNRRSQEPAVPVGLEQVLLMAGVESRFAQALRSEPEAALEASGVALSATERAILQTVSGQRLEQMAERVVATAQESTRRAFLSRASAVVVALAGGAAVVGGASMAAGCAGQKTDSGQASATKGGTPDMASMTAARQTELRRRHRVQAPTGIRPGPWPHITVGVPKIDGVLEPQLVMQKLKAYSGVVKRCWFGKGGRRGPGGQLTLDFTVDGAGKVAKASLNTGGGQPGGQPNAIESCILAAARGWRFPPSKPRPTKIQVTYKFEYRY